MAKTRTSRLVHNAVASVTFRVDHNTDQLLNELANHHEFVSRSEVIVEALHQMANSKGLKMASGGRYPVLDDLKVQTNYQEKVARETRIKRTMLSGITTDDGERKLLEWLTREGAEES